MIKNKTLKKLLGLKPHKIGIGLGEAIDDLSGVCEEYHQYRTMEERLEFGNQANQNVALQRLKYRLERFLTLYLKNPKYLHEDTIIWK